MKTTLAVLIGMFLLCTKSVYAQKETATQTIQNADKLKEGLAQTKAKEQYCMIRVRPRFLSGQVTIRLDYGQERNLWGGDARIRDEEGKVAKFNSLVDALNFMAQEGWVFVFAYESTVGTGKSGLADSNTPGEQKEQNFLMKRAVAAE